MTDLLYPELDLFAAPLHGVSLIEASAGTGKTWTVTGLFVRLIVEQGYRVEQILVVTYTKAATAELRERIRRRMAEALTAMIGGEPKDGFCRALVERATVSGQRVIGLRRLQIAIRNFDEAAIFTIHGFCQRVLTECAFESGMAFETELATDESSFIQEIVDDFWRRETAGGSLLWTRYLAANGQTPDAWQLSVRPHLGKPYLDITPIDESGELTATEQAFVDAFHTARSLWHEHGDEITEMLMVAANTKILKNTIYRPDALPQWFIDFNDYFEDEEAKLSFPDKLVKLCRNELEKGTAKSKQPPVNPFFNACSDLVGAAVKLGDSYSLRLVGLKIRLIGECNAELPRRKSKLGLISYDDLLNRLADALQTAEGVHLSDVIRARYQAALIDEFQDTDPVQCRIFRAIYARGNNPVFYVGDPKQAIYAFRGADVFSYLEARDQASAQYTLAVNQRSAPQLISAVNALFMCSPNPFLFRDIDYPPARAANKSRAKLIVDDDMGGSLRFTLMPSADKKLSKDAANLLAAQAAATQITALLNLAAAGKARLSGGGEDRPVNGGDIAVLVPTHRQGASVQTALAKRGVPAVRQGQDNVFQSNEAVELELILLGIAEPQREIRIRTALATELAGLDAATLFAMQHDEGAWENKVYDFTRYREIWMMRGFMPMFRHWLDENAVMERLLHYPDGERRLTNLLHLAELLQVKSHEKPGLEVLLAWYSRTLREPDGDDEALLRLESDAERVKIVTVHTSKGLEYPIVFCPFLWDGNLWRKGETAASFHDQSRHYEPVLTLGGPDYEAHRKLASQEKLAEKLRLLYVALTRAKHRCHLIWGCVSGMEHSALAWLLHGNSASADDPLASMESLCKELDQATIEKTLQEVVGQAAGAISLESLVIDSIPYESMAKSVDNLLALTFSRPYLRPTWRMTSFSALTNGSHSEAPDYDPAEPNPRDQPQDRSIFAFPRGAGAGRCLHAIFEEWDFSSTDQDALARLVGSKLKAHGIAEEWTNVVSTCVEATLTSDLDGSGLRLRQIDENSRLAELEFTYPVHELAVQSLKSALADKTLSLPIEFARAAESLEFDIVKGYMKGFIDLTFEAKGRFYILDYKSNWLGPTPQDYAMPLLQKAMAREHYYLQYLIYCLALHRYLGLRLPEYQYEIHFGGVFYLFLRGIGQDSSSRYGIFWDRPSGELIAALDGLMA